MTDVITITGIEVFAHHGVFDFERREGQIFRIDLAIGTDTRRAADTDDLQNTVDYGTVVDTVVAAVQRDPVDLIETLAARICDVVLTNDRVEWTRVTVHKPNAPIEAKFDDVTLTIERTRD
ncbi:MAG: dihydroneopterin aldolase [Nocardioides sp.]